MNKIWAIMLAAGILSFGFSSLPGTAADGSVSFSDSLFTSCEEAVYFVIGLAGIMGLWSGFMNIAKGSGLIHSLSVKCRKIMSFLFPNIKDEDTLMLMLMGFMANIFGAGNSATVFSLQAMKKLDETNPRKEYASNEMCMFATVNMSMLQLVPVTVVDIRSRAGSAAPEDIILPSLIAGLLSTITSIAVCKICERRSAPP
ncbi:MAG: spore maturation protein [Firmicutes bacterium]|nr:spore maturation protein [Bacillota bacterium]